MKNESNDPEKQVATVGYGQTIEFVRLAASAISDAVRVQAKSKSGLQG
jgi:hypothetical protein